MDARVKKGRWSACPVIGRRSRKLLNNRPSHDHPDVIAGQSADPGPYEFDFDFAIALDTKNGLIFSFVWNLQD